MLIALGVISARVGYVLYKTIKSTKKDLNIDRNKTKKIKKEAKELVSEIKEKKEKKKEVTREIKQEKIKEKTVTKKPTTPIKKTNVPKKNVTNRELTLSYLKNEYRRLYSERERMIKNNCSKEEIKVISDKMDEVGKRAFRIEIGEDKSFDKSMTKELKK